MMQPRSGSDSFQVVQNKESQRLIKHYNDKIVQLKSKLQAANKENSDQKDQIYNLKKQIKEQSSQRGLVNRQNRALKERQDKIFRKLCQMGKLNSNDKEKLREKTMNFSVNEQVSLEKTLRQLEIKIYDMESQLTHLRALDKSSQKEIKERKEYYEKLIKDSKDNLLNENFALKFELDEAKQENQLLREQSKTKCEDLERKCQDYEKKCEYYENIISDMNGTMIQNKCQNNSEMLLMSRDLTQILDNKTVIQENEGFFQSKLYARFFINLGYFCKCLTEEKKLTFLSTLNYFAETNLQNILDNYEQPIEDENQL